MQRVFKIFTDGGIVATDLEESCLDTVVKPWDYSEDRRNSKMGMFIQACRKAAMESA